MDENSQQLWDSMMSIDGNEITLVIERTLLAVDRDGLDRGLSAEAMHTLTQQIMIFLGTRTIRAEEQTGIMPQGITVHIKVDLDTTPTFEREHP